MHPLRALVRGEEARKRILQGDGSQASPYLIHASDFALSGCIQAELMDLIYGTGTYSPNNQRIYSYTPQGLPGNQDICEHRFLVKGKLTSMWFDLHLVTRLATDPELSNMKKDALVQMGLIKPEAAPAPTTPQPSPGAAYTSGQPGSTPSTPSGVVGEVIRIFAPSDIDACDKIYLHLAPHFEQGWIVQQSVALEKGWMNRYTLKRGEETKDVCFDLSPSLAQMGNTMCFSLMSMGMGAPKAKEMLAEFRRVNAPKKKGWLARLLG